LGRFPEFETSGVIGVCVGVLMPWEQSRVFNVPACADDFDSLRELSSAFLPSCGVSNPLCGERIGVPMSIADSLGDSTLIVRGESKLTSTSKICSNRVKKVMFSTFNHIQ
jgi:hypothetical protein